MFPLVPAIIAVASASAAISHFVAKHSRDKEVRRKAEIVYDISKIVAAVSSFIPMAPKAPIKDLFRI